MQSDLLITVATTFALTWAFGAMMAVAFPGDMGMGRTIFYAAASLAVLVVVIWMSSMVSEGRNSVVYLTNALLSRDLRHLCAAGLGLSLGFGPASWPWQAAWGVPARGLFRRLLRAGGFLAILSSFTFVGLLALENVFWPYLAGRDLKSILADPSANTVPGGFVLDEFYSCDARPVQLTIGPNNSVYATAYTGVVSQNGVVIRLTEDPQTGAVSETKVARNLNRPHGLAFYNGELYVSRSGQYTRAEFGALIETNTGAVTQLKDIDGDGIMDYFHDVISGLPGSQGPDTLHQNNGIAFSPDGYLYVTVGAHSDRAPPSQDLEGTIVRSRPDGSEQIVFARGMRNPFDVVVDANGEVFCTDNDASDRTSGDEVNHVVEGAHYGFPYADGKTPHPQGTVTPILVHTQGTLQGMAYTNSPKLPERYRNCLYVADYPSGNIYQLTLNRDGDSYQAKSTLFARVPGALDVAIDEDGSFYVCCYHSRKIYRLRYLGKGTT